MVSGHSHGGQFRFPGGLHADAHGPGVGAIPEGFIPMHPPRCMFRKALERQVRPADFCARRRFLFSPWSHLIEVARMVSF